MKRHVARRFIGMLLLSGLLAAPAAMADETVDPTVVYSWPHDLVDVDNKTALVQWAMEAAPGHYELGVVAGRSTFYTQIVDDNTARMLLEDPDFGTRQFTMPMEPIYGPDPSECAPASGVHRDGRFILEDDGCGGVPDTLRGGVISSDERPSFVMGGHGLAWYPASGAYHVGSDIMAGMVPFFEAVGLPGVEELVVGEGTPLGDSLPPPNLQYQEPWPTFACTCTLYHVSSKGPSAALDGIVLTVDADHDLVQVSIGPRVDWAQTPILPEAELDATVASFAAEHDLVVNDVSAWRIDRTTGGLNRSVDFVHAGLWEYEGDVDAAQQAHDGAVVIHEWREPYGLAHVSPSTMTIVALLVASVLVFWGSRT